MTPAEHLVSLGYERDLVVELPDGRIAWIHRLLFSCAILVASPSCLPIGYEDRWCYHDREDAVAALRAWNPATEPEPSGWHRHPTSGRRRPGGDAAKEYINR